MNTLIIDTREDFEYAMSHVEGSINIPPAQFMSAQLPEPLASAPKDTPIIVYCRSGSRANTVHQILMMHGFSNVTNGINEGRVKQLLKRS